MILGTLRLIIDIPASQSLKDKRRVVRSILDTARARFNVSAAEINSLDSRHTADIAFACVSNDRAVVNRMLNKIADIVRSNPLCEVADSFLDIS